MAYSPTLLINNNGRVRHPIWSNGDAKTKIGELYPNELYTDIGSNYYGNKYPSFALTAKKGWTKCWVALGAYGATRAYGKEFAYLSHTTSRHIFYVRRKCRIFRGEKEILSIYAGDAIGTDGKSTAGLKNPDRLSINAYRRNGKWKYESGLWCDTDINLYSSNPTVYGKW